MPVKKIVVIGPESTGKSTLSKLLAERLGTYWVPEYARGYLEALDRPYDENDLLVIAKGQLETEDVLSQQAAQLLICDTDLNVIKVWSEHSYHHCAPWVLEQIAERRYDLYLLTYIDAAWQDDPLREHPEENMRHYFFSQYKDIVINSGVPWVELRGPIDERLAIALSAIRSLTT